MIYYFIGDMARDFGKTQNYLHFLKMPERQGEAVDIPAEFDIFLSNVSFSYPGAQKKAVNNVTLTINNGETIAVVGENGSGKTTLVKLITGLYLPDSGDVHYDNANTKHVSPAILFNKISAVFQKIGRYQMTLRENINISDFDTIPYDESLDILCIQAGVDDNDKSFTNGYDTMLSREFDGVDLSGGQWQRIAIARSLFRRHQLIILDEPTAAIDPIEETNIYNRFAEIAKEKTALIVTHRLGSVRMADRIFVMKQGELVEQGTHDDLLAAKDEYYRLYTSQEQWYRFQNIHENSVLF